MRVVSCDGCGIDVKPQELGCVRVTDAQGLTTAGGVRDLCPKCLEWALGVLDRALPKRDREAKNLS